jgi:hypothetical protein
LLSGLILSPSLLDSHRKIKGVNQYGKCETNNETHMA